MPSLAASFDVKTHNGHSVNQGEGHDGDLTLNWPSDPIDKATFKYSHKDLHEQSFAVNFTGPDSSGNFQGIPQIPSDKPLHIPKFGSSFLSGSMTFNPAKNSLGGIFSSKAEPPGDDDITWEAKTGEGEHHYHKSTGQY